MPATYQRGRGMKLRELAAYSIAELVGLYLFVRDDYVASIIVLVIAGAVLTYRVRQMLRNSRRL